jgi:ATP-dependent DNA ligase
MLCTRLADPRRLDDPRYVAEPKFDGQRAQIHVVRRRTSAAYSRPGRSLLSHPGVAWLRTVIWPFDEAILDSELCADDGREGIQRVLEARGQMDDETSLVVFDILHLDGQVLMPEPWIARRKRLESAFADFQHPRLGLVPVSEEPRRLWDLWTAWGGEGIVLKDPMAPYEPGRRSVAWLKHKQRLTLRVRGVDGSDDLLRWGDWGWAARLTVTYTHPRTGVAATIDEMVRVREPESFAVRRGGEADVLCWGILPSGRLRHPVLIGWRETEQDAR